MHLVKRHCPHSIVDDVCWLCTAQRLSRIAVSEPSLGHAERAALLDVFDSGQITHGPAVEAFERALADTCFVQHAVACSSGTTALHLALAVILEGEQQHRQPREVLVPDLTFVATANAVSYLGLTPVLCDINPRTWAIDLDDAERKLSDRTVAILPVHLYGKDAEMTLMRAFADEHGLFLVEDAAEALGGHVALGTHSDAAVLSFYGNKVVTTAEGGAVLTNDAAVAARVRHFRGQGQTAQRYFHDVVGFNYRMSSLHAAIGHAQLSRLPELLNKRAEVFATYAATFRNSRLRDCMRSTTDDAPWLYTIELPEGVDRDTIAGALAALDIETRPAFVPLHRLPMYRRPDQQFPNATALGRRGLSLPTHPNLSIDDAEIIARCVETLVLADARRHTAQPITETEPDAGAFA